jgi:hypothetical protein
MYHRLRIGDTVTPFKLNFVYSDDLLEEDLDYLESQIRQESRLVNLTSFDYFLKDSKTQMLLDCELIRDNRRNNCCQKLNGDLHGISFTSNYKDEIEYVNCYFLGICFRRFHLPKMKWFEEYDDFVARELNKMGCLPCY